MTAQCFDPFQCLNRSARMDCGVVKKTSRLRARTISSEAVAAEVPIKINSSRLITFSHPEPTAHRKIQAQQQQKNWDEREATDKQSSEGVIGMACSWFRPTLAVTA